MLNKYLKCSVWRLALRYDIYIYIYIYIYMSLGFKRLSMLSWLSRPQVRSSTVFYSLICARSLLILRIVKKLIEWVCLCSLRFIVTACHKLSLLCKFPLLRQIRTVASSQFHVYPTLENFPCGGVSCFESLLFVPRTVHKQQQK